MKCCVLLNLCHYILVYIIYIYIISCEKFVGRCPLVIPVKREVNKHFKWMRIWTDAKCHLPSMWLTSGNLRRSARWTHRCVYSSWKQNWLRPIIGAVYIFKEPANSLLTTGSDFSTGLPCITALLFHSIFTGTLPNQQETRLHQTAWRPPCITTKQLSHSDPPWYKNQESITWRPPVKPWLLWGTKRRWRWFPHLNSASCVNCSDGLLD
jgi:hypothetical protein